jgi:hypothetical protein
MKNISLLLLLLMPLIMFSQENKQANYCNNLDVIHYKTIRDTSYYESTGKVLGRISKNSEVSVGRRVIVGNGIGECMEIKTFSDSPPYRIYIKTTDLNIDVFPIDSKIDYIIEITDYALVPYREINGVRYPIKGVKVHDFTETYNYIDYPYMENRINYFFIFDEESISLLPQERKGTYAFDYQGKLVKIIDYGTTIEASGISFSQNQKYLSLQYGTSAIKHLGFYDIINSTKIVFKEKDMLMLNKYYWCNNSIVFTRVLDDKTIPSQWEFHYLSNVEKYDPEKNETTILVHSNNLERAILVGMDDKYIVIRIESVMRVSDWEYPRLYKIRYVSIDKES